jgi:hypothetical protein
MKKPSEMQRGDMFLQLPNPLIGTEAKVFVKLEDAEGYTIFINNNALVKVCIGNYEPSFLDQWGISDGFYERMVEKGEFVPISDIGEVENYCPGFTIDL